MTKVTFCCPETEVDTMTQIASKKVGNLSPRPHGQEGTEARKTQSLILAGKSALGETCRVQVRDSGDQEDPPPRTKN